MSVKSRMCVCAYQDCPWLPQWLSGESHCPLKGQRRPSCNPVLLFIISPHLLAVPAQRHGKARERSVIMLNTAEIPKYQAAVSFSALCSFSSI